MIEIRLLNKQLLSEFINSREYQKLKHLPISKHRAISHINNPRANDTDILLLLALQNKQLVGYLGVLPEQIINNNKVEKWGWLSCLWIDENQRGKKIALQLVQKSLELWNKKILITEFTDPAKRLYDKTKSFVNLKHKKGLRLYVRFSLQTILPPKKNLFRKAKPLLKVLDFLLNAIFDCRFYFLNEKLKNISLKHIEHIDNEIENFIKDKQQNQLFKRGTQELNWILKNPWIINSEEDSNSKKYHFSSVDKRFEFVPLKIYNKQNKLIAFIIFSRRNDDLKIPYLYHDNCLETIVKVVNYHLIKWKIKTFTCFHNELALKLKKQSTSALFKKEINRNYLVSNLFDSQLIESKFEIQDGDGDCSFT